MFADPNRPHFQNDFEQYSYAVGNAYARTTGLRPQTLPEARFFRQLRQALEPGVKERITREQISEEIFERRGLSVYLAGVLLKWLFYGQLEIEKRPLWDPDFPEQHQNVYEIRYEWNRVSHFSPMRNNEREAVIDVFYWYWNNRPSHHPVLGDPQ